MTRLWDHVRNLITNYNKISKEYFDQEYEKIKSFWELLSPELKNQLRKITC
ncbi:MAG: hypothetical protein LBR43_01675 [Spiroplasmataceae bacterium]|nr:hypothetical protein [Spiroplasmataceae bacterium]